jgi:hypothetical protein
MAFFSTSAYVSAAIIEKAMMTAFHASFFL